MRAVRLSPFGEYVTDRLVNLCAGVLSVIARCEKLIIQRFRVSNMCDNGESNRWLVEFFGCSGTTDPATAFEARMFSDNHFPSRRASWEDLPNTVGKTLNVLAIQLGPPRGLPLSALVSRFPIGQALDFRSF